MRKNGILPFMDIHICRKNDKLIMKVYRKETHTNRYLNWKSNHSKSFLLIAMYVEMILVNNYCTAQIIWKIRKLQTKGYAYGCHN